MSKKTLSIAALQEHIDVLEALLEEALPYIAPRGHIYTAEDAGIRISLRTSIHAALGHRDTMPDEQ